MISNLGIYSFRKVILQQKYSFRKIINTVKYSFRKGLTNVKYSFRTNSNRIYWLSRSKGKHYSNKKPALMCAGSITKLVRARLTQCPLPS